VVLDRQCLGLRYCSPVFFLSDNCYDRQRQTIHESGQRRSLERVLVDDDDDDGNERANTVKRPSNSLLEVRVIC
jgi:hypothetical protein